MGSLAEAFADARLNQDLLKGDIASFLRTIDAAAKKADKALNIEADVNTAQATKAITALQAQMDALDQIVGIEVGVEDQGAAESLGVLAGLAEDLDANDVIIDVGVHDAGAAESLGVLSGLAERLDTDDVTIPVSVSGGGEATAELTAVTAATKELDASAAGASGGGGGRGNRGLLLLAIGLGGVGAAALAAGAALGTFGVLANAGLETVSTAFEGTLGTQSQAQAFLAQLQDFAAKTPFEFGQLTTSAQKLIGIFGAGFQDQLIPTLTKIGDVASALGATPDQINSVVTALGQIKGKGRAAAEELQQISEALPGFSAIGAVAQGLGITVPQAFKKLQLGAIDSDSAIQAILKGMEEFPGAAGAMARQSQTLAGKFSTLKDEVSITAREGFEPLANSVSHLLDQAIGPLGKAIDTLAPAINSAFNLLGPELIPLLGDLSTALASVLEGLGPGLADALHAIGPALLPLGEAFGSIAEAAGESVAAIATALTPALKVLAAVLNAIPTPVLSGIVTGLIALKVATTAAKGIDTITTSLKKLFLTSAEGAAGGLSFGPMGIAAAAATIGVGLLTAALTANAAKQQEIRQVTLATTNALLDLTKAFESTDTAVDKLSPAAETAKLFGEALVASGADADKIKTSLGNLGLSIDSDLLPALAKIQKGGVSALGDFSDELNKAFTPDQVKLVEAAVDKYDDLGSVLGQLQHPLVQTANGMELNTAAVVKLNPQQKILVKSLEELQDQAEKTNLNSIAQSTLAQAAASDTASAALIKQAEAQTGQSRSGSNAIQVYTAYVGLLKLQKQATLDATTAALAQNAAIDASAQVYGTGAQALADMQTVLDLAVGSFDSAAGAATAFDDALSRTINRSLGVVGAESNLQASLDDIRTGLDGAAASATTAADKQKALAERALQVAAGFNIQTEAGRKNGDAVRKAATDILTAASAELKNGEALDVVRNKTNFRVAALESELTQLGFNKAQVQAYIRQLGLTPDKVDTAIQLTGDEAAKAKAKAVQDRLKELGDQKFTPEIQALIDEGSFAAADRRLDELTEARFADIGVKIIGGGKVSMAGGPLATAAQAATGALAMPGDGAGIFVRVGEGGPETLFLPPQGEILNNTTTRRLEQVLSQMGAGGSSRGGAPGMTRLHPADIKAMANALAAAMPPMGVVQVPYGDPDAIVSKMEARWRSRGVRY